MAHVAKNVGEGFKRAIEPVQILHLNMEERIVWGTWKELENVTQNHAQVILKRYTPHEKCPNSEFYLVRTGFSPQQWKNAQEKTPLDAFNVVADISWTYQSPNDKATFQYFLAILSRCYSNSIILVSCNVKKHPFRPVAVVFSLLPIQVARTPRGPSLNLSKNLPKNYHFEDVATNFITYSVKNMWIGAEVNKKAKSQTKIFC